MGNRIVPITKGIDLHADEERGSSNLTGQELQLLDKAKYLFKTLFSWKQSTLG